MRFNGDNPGRFLEIIFLFINLIHTDLVCDSKHKDSQKISSKKKIIRFNKSINKNVTILKRFSRRKM